MDIGKIISKLRNEQGLTQRDLAEILGVSNGAIGMWETEKREPDLDTVKKIASFFNVTADYLIGNQQILSDNSKIKRITAEEEMLLQAFNRCDDECKKYLIAKARVLCVEGISATTSDKYGKYADKEKKSFPSSGIEEKRA